MEIQVFYAFFDAMHKRILNEVSYMNSEESVHGTIF